MLHDGCWAWEDGLGKAFGVHTLLVPDVDPRQAVHRHSAVDVGLGWRARERRSGPVVCPPPRSAAMRLTISTVDILSWRSFGSQLQKPAFLSRLSEEAIHWNSNELENSSGSGSWMRSDTPLGSLRPKESRKPKPACAHMRRGSWWLSPPARPSRAGCSRSPSTAGAPSASSGSTHLTRRGVSVGHPDGWVLSSVPKK